MKLIKRENNIYFASPEALEIRDRNQMLRHFIIRTNNGRK